VPGHDKGALFLNILQVVQLFLQHFSAPVNYSGMPVENSSKIIKEQSEIILKPSRKLLLSAARFIL